MTTGDLLALSSVIQTAAIVVAVFWLAKLKIRTDLHLQALDELEKDRKRHRRVLDDFEERLRKLESQR